MILLIDAADAESARSGTEIVESSEEFIYIHM